MSAAPKCANCGDSGRNPGSDYLDCTRCDAATQRVALIAFIDESMKASPSGVDVDWHIHQRAYAMGVAAIEARTVPDGWTMVPIDATETMVHAAEDLPAPRMFGAVYRAMVGAAPKVAS